ncbi:MAG TPA: 50S ribosomal protein L23 [Candidatus Thermoplasmatota archaeon]|nr:50S ribosomal protein L23 [Candidatus Thermoplasmatota archaeon]
MTRHHENAYNIILHPSVTEKTMFVLDKDNALEFVVRHDATKPQIKAAIKEIFNVECKAVNTRITLEGKKALVFFPEAVSAEELGMRIGVF